MANHFETLTIDEFVKKMKQPDVMDLITQEFEKLEFIPIEGTANSFYKNMDKNRYPDISCWDDSRVVLSSNGTQNHEHSDIIDEWDTIVITLIDSPSTYIHANYVDGVEDENKFILCQSPTKSTAGDMIKLIWEQNTNIKVALIGIDDESKNYYECWVRNEDCKIVYGRYVGETVDIIMQSPFAILNLKITDFTTGESRPIIHYWYPDWPNHGTPENLEVVVELLSTVNKQREETMEKTKDLPKPGPIVVHCLAGVGRSGTFSAADHTLSRLKKEKKISVQDSMTSVRRMRHSSVMTPRQYMFIYKIIEHVLWAEED